jgi:hypothetical protein
MVVRAKTGLGPGFWLWEFPIGFARSYASTKLLNVALKSGTDLCALSAIQSQGVYDGILRNKKPLKACLRSIRQRCCPVSFPADIA